MPSWVSRHSEPRRKLDLLEKRIGRLRGAVEGASKTDVAAQLPNGVVPGAQSAAPAGVMRDSKIFPHHPSRTLREMF